MNKEEWQVCALASLISITTLGFCVWISESKTKSLKNKESYKKENENALKAFDDLIEISRQVDNPVIIGKQSGARLNHPLIAYAVLEDHYRQIKRQLRVGVNIVRYRDSNQILLFILSSKEDSHPVCLYPYGKTKVKATRMGIPHAAKLIQTKAELKAYIGVNHDLQ